MARPTKYTEETVAQIINGIRAGLTNKDAALVAGVDPKTIDNWQKRYSRFSELITQARAKRSADWLAQLRKAGQKDWRAYAELLDRCAPEYRKKTGLEVSGPGNGPIMLNPGWSQLRAIILAAATANPESLPEIEAALLALEEGDEPAPS